ncbi:hypothetical protein vseg_010985 [Gypsophila vaccaria]
MEYRHWKGAEEFQEEDIWNVIKADREVGLKIDSPTPRLISRRLPRAATMIPWTNRHEQHDIEEPALLQQSAPVNVPDWHNIHGKNSINTDDEDDDDDGDRLPPHEWLARKYARSRVSSFSVCEGAGRTLKGRDLSRVRNAVLSKTGFI